MKLAFLNIQGGRTHRKWEEIFQAMTKERLTMYAVAETHLRGDETPPGHHGVCWEGCNRREGERKGGGVGAFCLPAQGWTRARQSCKEHLWMTGRVAGRPTAVGVVYMWTGRAANSRNQELWACLQEDIQVFQADRQILLVGDFNAHLDGAQVSSGMRQDYNGSQLLETAERFGLVIGNLQQKCEGGTTWSSGDRRSCIDYALLSPGLYDRLGRMSIDEEGVHSVGSDHNRLLLEFGGQLTQERTTCAPNTRLLTEEEIERLGAQLEERPASSYPELLERVNTELDKKRRKWAKGRGHKLKRWWDSEVRQAVGARKQACRAHRLAVMHRKPVGVRTERWTNYLELKRRAASLIQDKVRQVDRQFLQELRRSGRDAPRKFWRHIRRSQKHVPPQEPLCHPVLKCPMSDEEGVRFVADCVAEGFRSRYAEGHTPTPCMEAEDEAAETDLEEWLGPVGELEWRRVIAKVQSSTAPGLDGFPAALLKKLGPKQSLELRVVLSIMLETGEIPADWRCGRMLFLYKGSGERSSFAAYRPITVTSIVYRVLAQVLRRRMQAWAERTGVLGELQNGFRQGRRLEDNVFVLTQCVEVACSEGRELWAAFLDVEKAYDSVEHVVLLDTLRAMGLPELVVQRIQSLYSGTEVIVEWQGRSSQPVPIGRGLRQGCPLSPLLFMLLLCDLEADLQGSGRGFDLSYMEAGEVVHQLLPGLLYADDILLTANSRAELQELLDICSRHADRLGLRFSPRKCAVLQWGRSGEALDHGPLRLQGELIQVASTYRYLGVVVSTEPDYLRQHEQRTKEKAVLGQNVLKAKALWSFNRLEVLRGLWKAVSVPALTFANSVLCPSAATREFLERRQREVGRMALGCHRTTPNEAVQGDVGWASFETREAIAKLCFEMRVWSLGGERWVHRVRRYLLFTGRTTRWTRRLGKLSSKYEVPLPSLSRLRETCVSGKAVRERVKVVETQHWREKAARKPALQVYIAHKQAIRQERLYDNAVGSGLLFEARAGVLRTRQWQVRCGLSTSAGCVFCGAEEESVEHVVLACPQLQPAQPSGLTLEQALGFWPDLPPGGTAVASDVASEVNRAGAVGAVQVTEVIERTKRRLECWRQRSLECMSAAKTD